VAVTAPTRLRPQVLAGAALVAAAAAVLGLTVGPTSIDPLDALREVASRLPWSPVESSLASTEAAIVWEIRLPRVVLALLVGGVLALSGGAYQGVFRNPLADPYLLGVAPRPASARPWPSQQAPRAAAAPSTWCRWPRSPARWRR
jgi:iron complex transport system permease protein